MRILRVKDVKEKTGLPQSTIYAMVTKDQFPAPIPLGPRTTGWVEHEIDEWLDEKVTKRNELLAQGPLPAGG